MVHHAEVLRKLSKDEDYVRRVARDPDGAELSKRERAQVNYSLKLTRTPGAVTQADIDGLRDIGMDDQGISNLTDTVAYFNYVNRLADGLGVELEGKHWDPLTD